MTRGAARVLWAPAPFRAGFCITDDTDAATTQTVRAVYEVLLGLGLTATKTVWPFAPEAPCGVPATPPSTLRGATLEDPDYRALIESLAARGVEVVLHGASAGNNRRERSLAALDLADDAFGTSGTFICHSKNADNPYWEQKVAPNALLRRMLGLYSRHTCSGEVPDSPYFWGDACRARVRWIRLFRTRRTNTLAADPAMPYFETEKPLVRGWFSATKRSFHDCTTPAALDRLAGQRGLTVLYQYLHRYGRDDGTVDPQFRTDAERLAADRRIWTTTAAQALGRLQQIQAVVVAVRGREAFLANAGAAAVENVQVALPGGGIRLVPTLAPGALIPLGAMPRFTGPRIVRLDAAGRGRFRLGLATVYVNAGTDVWLGDAEVPPGTARFVGDAGYETDPPLSVPGQTYRTRLFLGQMAIIARELALRRRSLDTEAFLGAETIPLEDHANW